VCVCVILKDLSFTHSHTHNPPSVHLMLSWHDFSELKSQTEIEDMNNSIIVCMCVCVCVRQ